MKDKLVQLAESAYAAYETVPESTSIYQVMDSGISNSGILADIQEDVPREPEFYAIATTVSYASAGVLRKFGLDEETDSVLED